MDWIFDDRVINTLLPEAFGYFARRDISGGWLKFFTFTSTRQNNALTHLLTTVIARRRVHFLLVVRTNYYRVLLTAAAHRNASGHRR